WYYFNGSGAMQTDWQSINGAWYYFNGSGAMKTGWLQEGTTWYYLQSSGAMETGWLQEGTTWYYLQSNGAMKTDWLQEGTTWYYLQGNGAMKIGWLEENGKVYYFDTNGVWIENPIVFGKTIIVDPGHGGYDSGTLYENIYEKTIALQVGLKLKSLLAQSGSNVVMTRATDIFIPLGDRVRISNENKADIFVSVHVNSADATAAEGIETLYNSEHPKSKQALTLANAVQNALIKNTGAKNRFVKDRPELRVLKADNSAPPILVETGFLSNPNERVKLTSDKYQNVLAQSVFEGVLKYFSN
ncbi:N-acetylmuramoyl-L-alanine amidase, partial [Bacillus pseudomycoides]|uniref:N-acetylmuramoyl-L-alanine amidase family protein n=3 Tax=Bacillus pseudomycoides TaxID=64104 RepID=UPI000C017F3E